MVELFQTIYQNMSPKRVFLVLIENKQNANHEMEKN